jgi:hypothetical protein
MNKNILSLLLIFLPFSLLPAADESKGSPTQRTISFYAVDFCNDTFLVPQDSESITKIDFTENSTLCIKNDLFRTLLSYTKAGPRFALFKEILKKFNILLLYESNLKTSYTSINKEELQALMPHLQLMILFSKKNRSSLLKSMQLNENISDALHAYADNNLNIFLLSKENKNLKQIIQNWPADKKYDDAATKCFDIQKDEEAKPYFKKKKRRRSLNGIDY